MLDNSEIYIETVYPVYISMTTIKNRLPKTMEIIKNFLKNVKGFDKFILNTNLEIEPIHDPRFILNKTKDIGPITKIIPALSIIPAECILIVCDDDSYHNEAFKLIAEKQDKDHTKSFTYWKYNYEGTDIPQGVDLISFWSPHLYEFNKFYKISIPNKYCFYVDDLIIGMYLKQKGINIEQVNRKWKFPWFPSPTDKGLFSKEGGYSRKTSMKECFLFMK